MKTISFCLPHPRRAAMMLLTYNGLLLKPRLFGYVLLVLAHRDVAVNRVSELCSNSPHSYTWLNTGCLYTDSFLLSSRSRQVVTGLVAHRSPNRTCLTRSPYTQ